MTLEEQIADLVATAYRPGWREWREIDRLTERILAMPPRAHGRVILQAELCELMRKKLEGELA